MSNETKEKAGAANSAAAAAAEPGKVRDVKLVSVHEIIIPDELGQRQVVAPKTEFSTDAKTAEQLLKAGAAVKPKAKAEDKPAE